MDNPMMVRTLAACAFLAAASAQASEAPVRVRTDGLTTHMKQQVEAAAKQGPTALRQYLQRTRMLGYGLRVEEVAVEADLVGVVAKAAPAPVKERLAQR